MVEISGTGLKLSVSGLYKEETDSWPDDKKRAILSRYNGVTNGIKA
jgi:hypothetical protein